MTPVPELNEVDAVFGNIGHLPKWDDLPENFRREWGGDRNPYCKAISDWFYGAAAREKNVLTVKGVKFTAKEGVDAAKAFRALKAVIGSWEPRHEHKIAGAGFLISEWFTVAGKRP